MTRTHWKYFDDDDLDDDDENRPRLQLVGQAQLFYFGDMDGDLELFSQDWRLRSRSDRTLAEYIRHIGRYRSAYPGQEISLVNARDIVSKDMIRSQSVARFMARSLKAFDLFRAEEYDRPRALRRLGVPKDPIPKNTPTARPEDIQRMLDTCVNEFDLRDIRDRAILHTFRSTGIRLAELLAMTTTQVDMTNGHTRIEATKTHNARIVRLDGRARVALGAYHQQIAGHVPAGGPLWLDHRNYEPLNRGHITRLIRDRSLMAGVYVTAHAFRRGFAVLWFRHGGPAPYIKALAGWNSDSTIEVYVRSVANEEALRLHAQYFG